MKNFIILLSIIFLDAIALFIIVPMMPSLLAELTGKDIAYNSMWSSVLMLSYATMQFIFAPLVGHLSDKYGRKNIFIITSICFSVNFFIMAVAQNVWLVLIGRLLSGISGASMSTVIAATNDISTTKNRVHNFSWMYGVYGIGIVLGPVFGGGLSYWGTRIPFWVSAIIWLVNLFLIIFFFTETQDIQKRTAKVAGNSIKMIMRMTKYSGFSLLFLANFIFFIGAQSLIIITSFYTKYKFAWNDMQIGIALGFYGISYALSQIYLIKLIYPKLGTFKTLILGFIFNICGNIILGFASSVIYFYIGLFVVALGSITNSTRVELYVINVQDDEQGTIQGVLTAISSLAKIVGPPLVSFIFYYVIAHNLPLQGGIVFLFAALLSLISAIFFMTGYNKLKIK